MNFLKYTLVGFLGICIALFAFLVQQKAFNGNFYTVQEDVLYRSAQPTPEKIREYKEKYHIKSIISLRRARPDKTWWVQETEESKKLGLNHFDVALSSTAMAPMFRMKEMVRLLKNAPRPILVHCEGGSDRTGLAVALYYYALRHVPAEQAEKKGLNIIYGHFPYLGSKTDAMTDSFFSYVKENRPK